MLFLGIQFVIWSLSGAYMVIVNIDYIHGDNLINNHQTHINPEHIRYSLKDLQRAYPNAEQLELGIFITDEVYRFKQDGQAFMLDAANGALLSPINQAAAIAAAKHEYTGNGAMTGIELITDKPPAELAPRYLPAWRVNFDDFASPALYISAQTGQVVTQRHEFWRMFDLMFSLHIMDYETQDLSNWLLFWFSIFSLLAAILGLILTYFRVVKSKMEANI